MLTLFIGCVLFLPAPHAEQMSLRQSLVQTLDIIEKHTSAVTARLKVVSVAESQQYALTASDRIAGYPVTGEATNLDKAKSHQLALLLLDNNNYINIRQRCANQYFHGIRFSKDQQIIEVAIGIPCNQVLVVSPDGKKTKWWGGVFGDTATKQALQLLGK